MNDDLPAVVARAASLFGDRTALVIDATDERISYREVERRSTLLAGHLAAHRVVPGDRVAVMLPNGADFPLVWLAIAQIGAVMVPVNTGARAADASHLLTDAGVTLVVTTDEHRLVLAGSWSEQCTVLTIDELLTGPATELPAFDRDGSRLVSIQYTSGTTGKPKGCMLSHDYWVAIARQAAEGPWALSSADTLLTAQPFYYMDPQWNFVAALLVGAPLVVLDRFSPSTFMQRVRHHGVTFFYCLGVMPTLLLQLPARDDDGDNRLRFVLCSGIPAASHAELERRFGAPWFEIYGMTETGGATIGVRPEDHDRLIGSGALGSAQPGVEVRLVDGEIVLRGPHFMQGYWGEGGAAFDSEGWFRTGDLATCDEGIYTFHGRSKDVIKRGGENISASEVEEVLLAHPSVSVAALVAVPDALRGEEGKAFVVLRTSVSEEVLRSLAAHCAARLADFKVPRYWEAVDRLPLTPSEKVAKAQLPRDATGLQILARDLRAPARSSV